jgi:streptomycin 6-kinase
MTRDEWLQQLPATRAGIAAAWGLTLTDPYPAGHCSWVAPTTDGRVLKLGWLHPEALHEAEALQLWDGDGAVRLERRQVIGGTNAMLLERCEPGTTLRALPEQEQDVVVAGLLKRLWREPAAPFRPLTQMCDQWAADSGHEKADLFRELARGATTSVLLLTDLHAGNILAHTREPWLVIDPKPYVGDPHYDALQHMRNCPARLKKDPQGLVRRMAGLLDLDPVRLGLWLEARLAVDPMD